MTFGLSARQSDTRLLGRLLAPAFALADSVTFAHVHQLTNRGKRDITAHSQLKLVSAESDRDQHLVI